IAKALSAPMKPCPNVFVPREDDHFYFGIMGDKMTKRVRRMMFSVMLRDEIGWLDEEENRAVTLPIYHCGVSDRGDLTLTVSTNGIDHTSDSYSFCLMFNFRRTSLTGFPAQSVGSSHAIALESSYLLVLITGTSQSRQHGFPFITLSTKDYHSECSGNYHKDNA
ncbi:retrovirus-related pol polyprotein from transposon TNT 1-94, partial [Tanacetum coccineum]